MRRDLRSFSSAFGEPVTAPHVVHTWPLGWTVGSIGGDALTALQGRGTKRECKAQWIAAAVNASIAPDPSGARDGGPGSQQRTRRTVEMWNLLKRFQWVLSRKQASSNSSQTANCNSQTSSAVEKPVVEKEGTYPEVDLKRQPAGRFHELLGAASPWESRRTALPDRGYRGPRRRRRPNRDQSSYIRRSVAGLAYTDRPGSDHK